MLYFGSSSYSNSGSSSSTFIAPRYEIDLFGAKIESKFYALSLFSLASNSPRSGIWVLKWRLSLYSFGTETAFRRTKHSTIEQEWQYHRVRYVGTVRCASIFAKKYGTLVRYASKIELMYGTVQGARYVVRKF